MTARVTYLRPALTCSCGRLCHYSAKRPICGDCRIKARRNKAELRHGWKSPSERLSDEEIAEGRTLHITENRPTDRNECRNDPRPCPWVGCRHHTAIDVNPDTGSFIVMETDPLKYQCSLDLADKGGMILDEIAQIMGLTRERVRQLEAEAGASYSAKLSRIRQEEGQ